MDHYTFLSLRQQPTLKYKASKWFESKWQIPFNAYLDRMNDYITHQNEYGWYLCLYRQKIIGGLGVIENDFHDRKDLSPNICAVYVEEDFRDQGIAGKLLDAAVQDLKINNISPVYLVTDLIGFYEHYGWTFLCMVNSDSGELNRMYMHE